MLKSLRGSMRQARSLSPRSVTFSGDGADNDPAAIEVIVMQEDGGLVQRVRLGADATVQVPWSQHNQPRHARRRRARSRAVLHAACLELLTAGTEVQALCEALVFGPMGSDSMSKGRLVLVHLSLSEHDTGDHSMWDVTTPVILRRQVREES